MQQKADVFDQIEGPWSCRAFVHLLLVFGLMGVDTFKDAQPSGNQKQELQYCELLLADG